MASRSELENRRTLLYQVALDWPAVILLVYQYTYIIVKCLLRLNLSDENSGEIQRYSTAGPTILVTRGK